MVGVSARVSDVRIGYLSRASLFQGAHTSELPPCAGGGDRPLQITRAFETHAIPPLHIAGYRLVMNP